MGGLRTRPFSQPLLLLLAYCSPMLRARAIALLVVLVLTAVSAAQSTGPPRGTLILDGGGASDPAKDRFVELAGGKKARIVVIPTGASLLKYGDPGTVLDPDWPRDRGEWAGYEAYLRRWFGTDHVIALHTRDRVVADSAAFTDPITSATGVFLAPGNAGRLAASYLGTRTQRELEALLARGGVIFGSSAGAIIQGSFIVRGVSGKPVLIARGHDQGFGLIKNVAINPHLTEARRENELVQVVDLHPELLGIGLDEGVAMVVRGNQAEFIGKGVAALYDNQLHGDKWYYLVKPGDRLNLATRKKE